MSSIRRDVICHLRELYASENCPDSVKCSPCHANEQAALAWLVLVQGAILNDNINKLVSGQGAPNSAMAHVDDNGELRFFEPSGPYYPAASAAWKQLIEDMFPVHLFTLDPIVEEQNYTDAFSRRRELQLAMAMAVAKGEMRAAAAVRFTRQLSLDMLTIGLNRTAVAFAHDNDTFGWYFYPRLQSPPEESSNLAAIARLIWSTGPTRHYDLRNRQLEPGIRECEAVIVMPAFVPTLKIDITTNWERLVKPGAIKVDYVKMINQAAQIQQALCYSSRVGDQQCYRAEDYDVLHSRVEQLEKMLPLQQQLVRLPFPYVLGGTELFDNGNQHLPPEIEDFYGLEWLPASKAAAPAAEAKKNDDKVTASTNLLSNVNINGGNTATATTASPADAKKGDGDTGGVYFFISGRHFHPTQTHVIAGGVKADSIDATSITVTAKPSPDSTSPPPATPKTTDPPAAPAPSKVTITENNPPGQNPTVADVVVISRELLRVKLTNINPALTKCCVSVYVATPAGISNPLTIPLQGSSQDVCRRDGGAASADDCCACDATKPVASPAVTLKQPKDGAWEICANDAQATETKLDLSAWNKQLGSAFANTANNGMVDVTAHAVFVGSTFVFDQKYDATLIKQQDPKDKAKFRYALSVKDHSLVAELFCLFPSETLFAKNPPAAVTSDKFTIEFKDPADGHHCASGELTVTFKDGCAKPGTQPAGQISTPSAQLNPREATVRVTPPNNGKRADAPTADEFKADNGGNEPLTVDPIRDEPEGEPTSMNRGRKAHSDAGEEVRATDARETPPARVRVATPTPQRLREQRTVKLPQPEEQTSSAARNTTKAVQRASFDQPQRPTRNEPRNPLRVPPTGQGILQGIK